MKRLSADDSADACVKVGHRQAPLYPQPSCLIDMGAFGLQAYENQRLRISFLVL